MQPDGRTFEAKQWGDEWLHGWETADGFTIVLNRASGEWRYAMAAADGQLVPSERSVARDTPLDSIGPHLRPAGTVVQRAASMRASAMSLAEAKTISPIGTANIPVILVNFADTTTTYGPSDFDLLLFGAGNRSMRDYYAEVSYGRFTVSPGPGGVVGWFKAGNTHDYYGTNNSSVSSNIKDMWPGDLVYEAVAAADTAGFNFAPYDQNGDCYVDIVDIVHQGAGEDASGNSTDIWSHHWSLSGAYQYGQSHHEAYTTKSPCSTGGYIKVNSYSIQPETLYSGMSTMGVFAHEFGHALGLPDLYDTDHSSEGIGNWSLMAGGSWCGPHGNGDVPCQFDAWSKYALGWVTPHQVFGTLPGQSIAQVEGSPDVYQFRAGSPHSSGEYFLVENRQQVGFDTYLPGAGLLIWHVDESRKTADNTDNADECYPGGPSCATQHYRVALEQADGQWSLEKNINRGDNGDPFPGSSGNTAFTASSAPNSLLYSGQDAGVRVTNISTPASIMIATLALVAPCTYTVIPTTVSFDSTGGSGSASVTADSGCPWTAVSNAGWIALTSGANGAGSGLVGFIVQANSGAARTGTLTVAGQIVTVAQSAGNTVTMFSDGFEGSFPGQWKLWVSTGQPDTTVSWGRSTYRNTGGVASLWCAGGGTSAQPQGGNYLPNMGTWAVYGPFSLADATAAQVQFETWYNTETYNSTTGKGDRFWWVISTDGANFSGFYLSGNSGGWVHKTMNFSDVTNITAVGASQVWFAFLFSSDSSVQAEGAYVDNFVLTKTVASPACTYTLNPTSQLFSTAGGTGSVSVTAGSGCAWTAASQSAWITITAGATGTGTGTVSYSAQANSGSARTGTITIAGQTFTVNQAALTCSYSLAPQSANLSASGGTGSFTVTSPTGCQWSAAWLAAWINVTSGANGSGIGTVSYSVQANTGSARTGTITVGGQTFTVNQSAGGPSYTYSYWVPVASHASGFNQSQWRSDLGLLNTGSVTANVQLKFFGINPVSTTTYVPPGVQSILTDVVGQLGGSGSGALQISSDQMLGVTARTYNQVVPTAGCYPGGTQGQDYPVLASGDGLAAGESAYLPGLSENASYRCNIGLVNTGTASVTALVELYDGAGTRLGGYTVPLAVGQWVQAAQPFMNVAHQTAMDRGYAKITAQSGSGVFAFASVVDNITNDPTTVVMQR
jgi:M6 family metalloprotease-like protein